MDPSPEEDESRAKLNTDLDPECLDVVGAVGAPCEVREVELDLVPAVVQPHRHGADERFDTRRALVVAGAKSPTNVLVIQHLQYSRIYSG